jgi:ESCRT-II complex subunit VPS25
VLSYQKSQNQAILSVNEDTPLFNNTTINRTLPLEGRILVLDGLSKTGNAATVDKRKLEWEIYWFTLEEWANLIHSWATDSGMTYTVCTLFEITSDDNSKGQEFHNLDERVLLKALKVLETRGKCEVFDNNEGVKFF